VRDDGRVVLGRSTLAGGLALALFAGCTSGAGDGPVPAGAAGGDGSPTAPGCGDGPLRLAGSPAQDAAVAEWVRAYRAFCPGTPTVPVPGPAAAAETVLRGQAQLAAAELPPPADPDATGPGCPGGRTVGLPVLAAPVTVVHSLPGRPALTVTPSVLARVYLGQIKEWSDPEIAAANPGAPLPSTPITVVRPAAATAGTEVLSRFLAARVPELWTAPPAPALPADVVGAAAADVIEAVRRVPGALGYVDGPVSRGDLAAASVDAGSGGVPPTPAAVRSAVASADVDGKSPDVRVTVDPAADKRGAYPLALVGYLVTCAGAGKARARPAAAFLAYATGDAGQAVLNRLGYAALPDGLRGRVRAAVAALDD